MSERYIYLLGASLYILCFVKMFPSAIIIHPAVAFLEKVQVINDRWQTIRKKLIKAPRKKLYIALRFTRSSKPKYVVCKSSFGVAIRTDWGWNLIFFLYFKWICLGVFRLFWCVDFKNDFYKIKIYHFDIFRHDK